MTKEEAQELLAEHFLHAGYLASSAEFVADLVNQAVEDAVHRVRMDVIHLAVDLGLHISSEREGVYGAAERTHQARLRVSEALEEIDGGLPAGVREYWRSID